MNKGTIKDYRVQILPSKELLQFINKHIDKVPEVPQNISRCMKKCGFEVPAKVEIITDSKTFQSNNINLKLLRKIHAEEGSETELPQIVETTSKRSSGDNFFFLSDIHWLSRFFSLLRNEEGIQCYMHEYIQACDYVLPENEVIERNPELEARCQKLREEQQNREYRKMTKDVDAVLKNYPEDTIAYQMKAINSQIIAVLQFVFSVVAGFVFGFLGVELIIGNLDFGFRLLLGIMCALIIALAEIYFLAKKLNEIDDATSSTHLPPQSTSKQKLHKD